MQRTTSKTLEKNKSSSTYFLIINNNDFISLTSSIKALSPPHSNDGNEEIKIATILVVDDNIFNIFIIEEYCKRY